MAITTNSLIDFFGTGDEVISIAGAAVSDGAFSDSGDFTAWTNDDDAREAIAVLDATMGANPDAGSRIGLYARLMNISDTTEDQNAPSTTFEHLLLGYFPMDSSTTAQILAIPIALPNVVTSQVYDFYVKNESGQNLNTGSTVDIIPKAVGPHG